MSGIPVWQNSDADRPEVVSQGWFELTLPSAWQRRSNLPDPAKQLFGGEG